MYLSRRSISTTIAAALLFGFSCLPVAAGRHKPAAGKTYAVVDIDTMGYVRLEALKAIPSVDWWVEMDAQLLVCGDDAMLGALAGYRVRAIDKGVRLENLRVIYELHTDDAKAAGLEVLARGGHAAVVQASARQLERLEHTHDYEGEHEHDGPYQTHNIVVPFAPNAVLARQAANDPPHASPNFDVAIQTLVDSVDGNRWFGDIQTLASWNRNSRQPGNTTARDWLVSQFQALPGMTVTTQSFSVPGSPSVTSYNVIATLMGTTRPNDWYVVGGHFDSTSQSTSVAAPGAEDNGSGTAGVLEMARIFSAHPPEATVLFICYSGEEQGLYGSLAHASSLVSSGDSAKFRAAIIMDMIGYTGDADKDCLLETGSIGQFLIDTLSASAAQYTTLRIVTSLNPFGSDHVPYLNRGMPALLTIENDWDTYPNYHRTTDTPENITIDMGVQTLRMNVGALAMMTGTPPAGNGNDTVGVYAPATSTFFLKNTNAGGAADAAFQFGGGGLGYVALSGDWNGDGTDTVGLYDPATSTFFLKNSNTPGAADAAFPFGSGGQGFVPLVGDWDANGTDTVGLYAPATGAFFLRNSNTPGAADLTFFYGPANATPLVGDWDGNGTDTAGVYVAATGVFFLKNTNAGGNADLAFTYGAGGSGQVPIVGDWNGDNADTVGLYQPGAGSFFLRDSNTPGAASLTFFYGPASGVTPLRGDWNNQ
jgi:hypothetical protein